MASIAVEVHSRQMASEAPASVSVAQVQAVGEPWGAGLRERLGVVRRFRAMLAERSRELLAEMGHLRRTRGEVLASEVIPLADACRFLEREAPRILRPRKLGRSGRPMWVGRVTASVHREAVGRVLVIGPANYPLFLPGVQVMQGLVAGNEVSVKPGRGGAGVMRVMARLLMDAGLPSRMLTVMGEEIEAVERAVAAGVDKVFLTGGAEAGRAVLRMLAERGVPAVMELSGCDAAVVLASADVERAVAAIGYGMRLNGGETCIAPRRLFVAEGVGNDEWRTMNDERGKAGVRIVRFGAGEDVAALVNACPHKLGATIFGDEAEAKALAMKLDVGMVVINDMIAPTADPRVPFGGRGLSGFGVTRGREGLLEMTAVKTVIHRQGSFLPHLDAGSANDEAMFEGYLRGAHGATISERVRGAIQFLKLAMKRGRE